MKAGDQVKVIDGPYTGVPGLVAMIDWKDSDRAWVVFEGVARAPKLPPGWWSTTQLQVIGHLEHDVYTSFLEALESSSLLHVYVAEIHDYMLKTTGHVVLNFEVEALLDMLFPNQEKSIVSRDEEEEDS